MFITFMNDQFWNNCVRLLYGLAICKQGRESEAPSFHLDTKGGKGVTLTTHSKTLASIAFSSTSERYSLRLMNGIMDMFFDFHRSKQFV